MDADKTAIMEKLSDDYRRLVLKRVRGKNCTIL